MEISGASTSPANLAHTRLETPRTPAVTEPTAPAPAVFVEPAAAPANDDDAKSRFVPAGLTFSPQGLSAGTERRFLADL